MADKDIFYALHSRAPVQGHKAETQQLVLVYMRSAGKPVLGTHYQHYLIFLIWPHLQKHKHT